MSELEQHHDPLSPPHSPPSLRPVRVTQWKLIAPAIHGSASNIMEHLLDLVLHLVGYMCPANMRHGEGGGGGWQCGNKIHLLASRAPYHGNAL